VGALSRAPTDVHTQTSKSWKCPRALECHFGPG
jgi:hypothetical protein